MCISQKSDVCSITFLAWFEDVSPAQPTSGPSPPLYQPLLPFCLRLWVGVLTALNTGYRRSGRFSRRRGRQMEAVSCPDECYPSGL